MLRQEKVKKTKNQRLALTAKFKHGLAKSIIVIICMPFHMRFWYRHPLDFNCSFSLKENIWNVEFHSVQDFLSKKNEREMTKENMEGNIMFSVHMQKKKY